MNSKSLPLVPLLVLALASPAYAAEGGLLSPDPGLIVWTIITFLIVLVLLYKFAYPHILGAVEAREARIRDLIAEAERDREQAQALMEEQRRTLEETRARVSDAIAESRVAAERMREEMIAETRREQEEMLARARQDIERQTERALDQVRREAVELAMAAAERIVARNLSTADNRRFVEQFLQQVEAAPVGAVNGRVGAGA